MIRSKKINFILNPILVAMLSLPVYAQAENDMDTMIVTANRTSQSISDIAATVLVIEGEEIAEQAQSGIEFKSILANLIPSLNVGSDTSRSNAGQYMRGRTTLVMIDGISLNSSRLISRQFDSINPFNIARIEVVSGTTAIYGGGSSGGIINIITKKGTDAGGLSGETWVGVSSGGNSSEDLEYQVAQSVSMKNEKMDGRFAVSYNQTGAMYNADGDMVLQDITQSTSQYVSQIDIMGTAGFNISESKRIDLMVQYYKSAQDSSYGVDYGESLSNYYNTDDVEMDDSYNLDGDQAATERFLITTEYSDNNFYNQKLNVQFYARSEQIGNNPFVNFYTLDAATTEYYAKKYDSIYYDYMTNVSASQQDTQNIGSKLVLSFEPVDKLNVVYGADINYEKFTATQTYYDIDTAYSSGALDLDYVGEGGRYPDVDTASISAFLQASYDITPDLVLNSGIRYQYSQVKVSDFVGSTAQYLELAGYFADGYFEEVEGGTNDYNSFSTNVSLKYDLTKKQQVWVDLSQGYEIPDSAKFYSKSAYDYDTGLLTKSSDVSDNPLEAIMTNSIELGWRTAQDNFSAQLAAYFSYSDKQIEVNNSDYSIDIKADDKRIYGIEGQASYFITQAVNIGGNFNFVKTESKEDGNWENITIQTASPSKATAYVNWNLEAQKLSTRLQTTQVFDYKDADGKKLEGYNTVDLLSSVELPVGRLQLGITNLLNTNYDTLWSQRAVSYYAKYIEKIDSTVNSNLFEMEGQGRTYSLNYSVDF